jgi:hypothetical protein
VGRSDLVHAPDRADVLSKAVMVDALALTTLSKAASQ